MWGTVIVRRGVREVGSWIEMTVDEATVWAVRKVLVDERESKEVVFSS